MEIHKISNFYQLFFKFKLQKKMIWIGPGDVTQWLRAFAAHNRLGPLDPKFNF